MAVLDEKTQTKIDELIDLANQHYDDSVQYEHYMFKALELYSEPRYQWNEAYSLFKQLFDAYLYRNEYDKAKE